MQSVSSFVFQGKQKQPSKKAAFECPGRRVDVPGKGGDGGYR